MVELPILRWYPSDRSAVYDLLPGILRDRERVEERPDLILAAWPQIIGDKLALYGGNLVAKAGCSQ
jgi:hypothetical protein